MKNQVGYEEYRVLTASPAARVRILYDKAISQITAARECLAKGDPEGRARNVSGAFSILTELVATLNPEVAPELCSQLKTLYEYLQWRLVTGHAQRDAAALQAAEDLLRSMAGGWVDEKPSDGEPLAEPMPAEAKARMPHPYERQGAIAGKDPSVYL